MTCFIAHHRACGSSTVYIGPFEMVDDAIKYALDNQISTNITEMLPPVTPIPDTYWFRQPWQVGIGEPR